MIKQKIIKLDNGLNIVCASDDSKHYVYAEIAINFGSSYNDFIVENKEYHIPAGLQHLLEHMLLEHGPYGDVAKYFNDNFVKTNGYTGNGKTTYFIQCYEKFEDHFTKLFKTINNSNFSKEDVDVVKPPIYEEIRRAKDDLGRKYFLKKCESVFNSLEYPLGVGEIDDVKNFTYEDLQLIYNAFYKPSNEFIYIHGNFDIDKTISLIKKLSDEIDRKFLDSSLIPFEEKDEVNEKEFEYIDNRNYELISVNYKINIKDYKGLEKMKLIDYLDCYISSLLRKKGKIYRDLFDNELTKYTPSYDSLFSMDKNYFCISITVVGNDKENIVKVINDNISNYVYPEEKDFNLMKKNIVIDAAVKLSEVAGMMSGIKTNISTFDYYEWDTLEYVKDFSLNNMKKYVDKIDFSNYSTVIRKNEM